MKQVDKFLITRAYNFDIHKDDKLVTFTMGDLKHLLVKYNKWKERTDRWKRLKK